MCMDLVRFTKESKEASLVSKFQWQSATGAIHPFQGSDKVLRDYIWVGDIVNVVLTNNAGSGIFDLGTGKAISIQHVADLVAQKSEAMVEEIPFPPNLVEKYQFHTQADMNWLSNYNFRTVDDYVNHLMNQSPLLIRIESESKCCVENSNNSESISATIW